MVQELVHAGLDRPGGPVREIPVVAVGANHVAQRAGVRADDAVHAPDPDHHILDNGMDGHGNHVPGVVCRHETARPTLRPPHAEGDGIVFIEEPLIEIGGGAGAALFVAVGQEVLEQRGGLPVLGVVTLHAFDERHCESPGKKRVLAVALLVAAPADVATQVGIGRPDDQRTTVVIGVLENVAGFVPLRGPNLMKDVGIPSLA